MTSKEYRGVVRDGMVAFQEEKVPLIEGTEVLVTPVTGARGSPAAVVAAVESPPQVPTGWVDELEQLIALGRRPPALPDPFLNEVRSEESE